MSAAKIPLRSEIPDTYKWNAESVYLSSADFDAELQAIPAAFESLGRYQGHLADGAETLLVVFQAVEALLLRVSRLDVYGMMSYSVDSTDQAAARRNSQAQSTMAQATAAAAFIDPELIAIGETTLKTWLAQSPSLAVYTHYIDNLFRKQAHVRSTEVEELLGLVQDPFHNIYNTLSALSNADFKFAPAVAADGSLVPITASTFDNLMGEPDRELRRTAYESYTGVYLQFKNSLASNLSTAIKARIFETRARRYASALELTLFNDNLPRAVFDNLIETCRRNLPTWHRYWAIRRKALGLQELQPFDIWAPLTANQPQFTYEQTVEWICQGLAPLGEDYVQSVRRGCLEQRWVDVFPNVGKWDGAFSAGAYGTFPFILMNFDGLIFGLSTLAHELGHSMHSYLSRKNQPFIYGDYSTFAAEIASNCHQALVRTHLLETNRDRDFQISVIEEAMANFHRYFFIMPILARWELEIYQREERGAGLSADDMIALMADLFAEGFGGEMTFDRQRLGITWATFPHMYMNFYVFQYATGISGANAFARRIRRGDPGAAEAYLGFLKSGGSMYPLDSLRKAGLDLSTPAPVEETFEILSSLVDRLEVLVAD
ncbi:MAG: Oligoendopeptidase [Chloroflexi bacterium]|nr:Oligoendopeptidase [Chloroflexota bacterium]